MEIKKLSHRYRVSLLTAENIADIYAICLGNPLYFKYLHTQPSMQAIQEDLRAVPLGKTLKDKAFIGFYEQEELIAFMDLISGYPDAKTAYIGWFMVKSSWQGKQIGSAILREASYALQQEGYQQIMLGYAKDNPQPKHFWEKQGFLPTGKEVDMGDYTAIVMKKLLRRK